MKINFDEIRDELKSILSGKTVDTLIPPLLFVIIQALFGLNVAVIAALGLALILGLLRVIRKQPWHYALAGLLGVSLAAGLAYFTQNAASYFIPGIVSSGLFVLAAVISNLIGKPMAALVSHLARSWPLAWFWRQDVKPAYREVTWVWALLFSLRLGIQLYLYRQSTAATLAWANTLLGWPVTVFVLVISYIYGIWRLRQMGGPGVDEFTAQKEPPWEGQTKGF